jgi:ribosomal protein S4
MEVKKRILYSTPHMGGQKLKELARLHARKGTMDSFVADLESRLDRFLLRCNLVRSEAYLQHGAASARWLSLILDIHRVD